MACCENNSEEIFEGRWFQHPLMRNALLGALVTAIAFVLAHLKLVPNGVSITLYLFGIALASHVWAKEGNYLRNEKLESSF